MPATRQQIAARVAQREFDTVNPSRQRLPGHVEPQDIRDWLAAHDPKELSEELSEILADDNLAGLGLDTSHLAECLYTRDPFVFGTLLALLRDRYAKARIVETAGLVLTDLIHDAQDERAGKGYPKTCTTWQERAAWDAGVSLRGEL